MMIQTCAQLVAHPDEPDISSSFPSQTGHMGGLDEVMDGQWGAKPDSSWCLFRVHPIQR